MKTLYNLFFLIITLTIRLSAQDDFNVKQYGHNATLLTKGSYRYSLFSKAEYGISDKITLSAHPIWLFLSPSVDLKWQVLKKDKQSVALVHGISYPTPIMRLVSREGTGGFISPEYKIPFMLTIKNSVIATWEIPKSHTISGEAGLEFALFNANLEPGSSVDLPIISPRTAVLYKNLGFNAALGAEGKLIGKFDYYAKGQIFLFPLKDTEYRREYGTTSTFFSELNGMIFWNTSKKCKLGFGGKLCYGDYPFGKQWHLLPFIDFVKYIQK